jgi:hypothetical protein
MRCGHIQDTLLKAFVGEFGLIPPLFETGHHDNTYNSWVSANGPLKQLDRIFEFLEYAANEDEGFRASEGLNNLVSRIVRIESVEAYTGLVIKFKAHFPNDSLKAVFLLACARNKFRMHGESGLYGYVYNQFNIEDIPLSLAASGALLEMAAEAGTPQSYRVACYLLEILERKLPIDIRIKIKAHRSSLITRRSRCILSRGTTGLYGTFIDYDQAATNPDIGEDWATALRSISNACSYFLEHIAISWQGGGHDSYQTAIRTRHESFIQTVKRLRKLTRDGYYWHYLLFVVFDPSISLISCPVEFLHISVPHSIYRHLPAGMGFQSEVYMASINIEPEDTSLKSSFTILTAEDTLKIEEALSNMLSTFAIDNRELDTRFPPLLLDLRSDPNRLHDRPFYGHNNWILVETDPFIDALHLARHQDHAESGKGQFMVDNPVKWLDTLAEWRTATTPD